MIWGITTQNYNIQQCFAFSHYFQPSYSTPNLKEIFMKHWHLITENNKLTQTFPKPPIVAYQKDKSLKDILVRAKISSHI